jgi:hypothetical protein
MINGGPHPSGLPTADRLCPFRAGVGLIPPLHNQFVAPESRRLDPYFSHQNSGGIRISHDYREPWARVIS